MTRRADRLLFGAAYYPEHDPESEWPLDAALMADAGFNAARVGEFCWSRMQKADGTLTLDWLERLVDVLAQKGIGTVLCTPTATPPVWLVERYADLSPVLSDGRRGLFGGRRHYSAFHEGYRERSREIAAALASRFGGHQGVIGWHIDNEVGSYSPIDCSEPALRAFHRYLERTYGSVDELNRRWGLIFWNQEVERFDQIPAPTEMMCTRSPQHVLAYNRFCLEGLSEYILLQAEAIRGQKGEHQWVVGSCHENLGFTLFRLQREWGRELLDYVEFNNYPELMPQPGQTPMHLDRQRAIDRPRRFLTLEMQTGSGYTTSGGLDPAVRRYWAWETLARGSLSVFWFHWRRFRTGCEWRHTSVLERDRRPRGVFRSIQGFIREARKVEPVLLGARVCPDVQVYLDPDSVIARDRSSEPVFWMEFQLPGGWAKRFPMWEKEVRRAVYLPLSRFGLTLDFVLPTEPWDPAKPLIVPDIDLCTDAVAERLRAFCRSGGTVACFPGAGERDGDGAQVEAPSPGRLSSLFGVRLADAYPLKAGLGATYDAALGRLTSESDPVVPTVGRIEFGGASFAADVRHAEVLDAFDAKVVGTYADGPVSGSAAVSERREGGGRAVYLGAVPADADAACALYRALFPLLCREALRCSKVAFESGGSRYAFYLNDSDQPCELPGAVFDLIAGATVSRLAPYGIALCGA